jgi:serine protease
MTSRQSVILLTCLLFGVAFLPEWAAAAGKSAFIPPLSAQPSSNRLIVKLRSNKAPAIQNAMGVLPPAEHRFTAQLMERMQTSTGIPMNDLRTTVNGAHVLQLNGKPAQSVIEQAADAIRALPEVEYVEEDKLERIQAVPNDSNYNLLWGLQPVSAVAGTSTGFVGNFGSDFETAWNTSTGTNVVVAVVDSGITAHPDIVGAGGTVSPATGNLASPGYDFISDCRMRGSTSTGGCAASTSDAAAIVSPSPVALDTGDYIDSSDIAANSSVFGTTVSSSSWHGTHVAGTIAALANNATGVVGGAYDAKILPVRALGKSGGYSSDISEAILWAAGVHPTIDNPTPAKIINLSLGSIDSCNTTRQSAINAAVAAGSVVIVSTGNENTDVATSTSANCSNVISVAAISRDGSRASYSNFTSPFSSSPRVEVTLSAPGGDATLPSFDSGIFSTVDIGTTISTGAGYAYAQGTSMAAPHVSAAVALMLARNPNLTPVEVKAILSSPAANTAFPSFISGWSTWDCSFMQNCGAGILNANLAVQNSTPPLTVTAGDFNFGTTPVNDTVANRTVTLTNNSGAPITVTTSSQSGIHAFAFTSVANTCDGSTLAAGASCQITFGYTSSQVISRFATLTVNTATTPAAILAMSATSGQGLKVASNAVTGPTVAPSTSATLSLTYTNPNSVTVTPSGFVIFNQNNATISAVSNGCNNIALAAGASCSVMLNITGRTTGSYSAQVRMGLTNTVVPPITIYLNGTVSSASAANSGSSSGGGGCAIMPVGTAPDFSLVFALLLGSGYAFFRRRRSHT